MTKKLQFLEISVDSFHDTQKYQLIPLQRRAEIIRNIPSPSLPGAAYFEAVRNVCPAKDEEVQKHLPKKKFKQTNQCVLSCCQTPLQVKLTAHFLHSGGSQRNEAFDEATGMPRILAASPD